MKLTTSFSTASQHNLKKAKLNPPGPRILFPSQSQTAYLISSTENGCVSKTLSCSNSLLNYTHPSLEPALIIESRRSTIDSLSH